MFGHVWVCFPGAVAEDAKHVFIVFFLGAHLRRKLTRLCESMSVRLYLYEMLVYIYIFIPTTHMLYWKKYLFQIS